MKKLVLLCLALITFSCNCVDMSRVSFEQDRAESSLRTERDVSSVRSHSPTLDNISRSRTPPLERAWYIPRHYDLTEEFHNDSVLCFKLRRWVFQPVSVVLQVTAGGLFAASQCCMDTHPEAAKTLGGVGLGVTVASFITNTLLLKIDNKLEEMDNYILQRREEQDRENRRMIPAIIQR